MKKKFFLPFLAVAGTLLLASWGRTGHYTIGEIAEKHLTTKAATAVKDLLGSDDMAGVSTWADQIRSQDEYKYTAPWHYVNVPSGLSAAVFRDSVMNQQRDNVYKALMKCEADLKDSAKTKEEKLFALKFVVHLVGDLHQPMHTGHSDDSGGNKVMITFLGQPGNLHGLWDSGLLEHEGLTYKQLAAKIDTVSKKQIREWQKDDAITWLYESYQISNQLYADAAKSPDFDEAYYQSQVKVFEDRMECAGIRLAGVLNEIYK